MILNAIKKNKFDEAKTFEEKAKAIFGKEVGLPIGLAYQKYFEYNNKVQKYNLEELILYKFSSCKELYDRYLKDCEKFKQKSIDEKIEVYLNFLLERIPDEWLQNECGFNDLENIEDTQVEIDKRSYNINDIEIYTQKFTIQALHKKHTYDEINFQPAFQRKEVWTKKQKSLLIESILINIPIPAFYVDDRNSAKWNVIDGMQRLSTIMGFVNDDLELGELDYLDLKGRKFSTLDRKYQRRIEDCELTFNLVRPGTPEEIAFNIFTRINTLGTPLSAQEIRHAMNLGTSTNLLETLSTTKEFILAVTHKNYLTLSKRMADRALILRYLCFKIMGYTKDKYINNNMDRFLISGMKLINNLDPKTNIKDKEYIDELIKTFKKSMAKSQIIFGDRAFRKYFSKDEKKRGVLNLPLFETITLTLENYSIDEIELHKEKIFDKFLELFNEKDTNENEKKGKFLDWITNATNNVDHVRKRFIKVEEIFKEIIGH